MLNDLHEVDEIEKAQHIEQIVRLMTHLSISLKDIQEAYNNNTPNAPFKSSSTPPSNPSISRNIIDH